MLFTFPSRYWSTIGLTGVFSLAGWSRLIRAGLLVSRVTQDTTGPKVASHKGLSPAVAELSRTFRSLPYVPCRGPTTPQVHCYTRGLGSSPVARHYWGNHCCFLLLGVLRCFSSPGSPHALSMIPSKWWVVPFGNPRINGHLHLPAAYRSLSRPSSPP